MTKMIRNGVTKEWKESDVKEMERRGWVEVKEQVAVKEVKNGKSSKSGN